LVFWKLWNDRKQQNVQNKDYEAKITKLELALKEKPDDLIITWALARVLLEKYMNQNLRQVSYIFWLTVIIMLSGFNLIVIGVNKIFNDPTNFAPAILSAVSGILVDFIGATFLVVYKSIMSQAKEYVLILERINAVRMSIEALQRITDETIKNLATKDLVKQILLLYS
jgi:dihydroxyacetone kinase DhaKLM complex PTS-EIIA-like component DhaM